MIYVNDIFITGNCALAIQRAKTQLQEEYEMTDLGEVQRYLGVEFTHTQLGLILHQSTYCQQILSQFQMENCRPISVPLLADHKLEAETNTKEVDVNFYCTLIVKLLYLSITRIDISFAVGLLSRYMSKPQERHLDAALHVLRYLKGTTDHGLYYQFGRSAQVQGFTDADWGMCRDTFRSTGGSVFTRPDLPYPGSQNVSSI
jgi:hypothetical protein